MCCCVDWNVPRKKKLGKRLQALLYSTAQMRTQSRRNQGVIKRESDGSPAFIQKPECTGPRPGFKSGSKVAAPKFTATWWVLALIDLIIGLCQGGGRTQEPHIISVSNKFVLILRPNTVWYVVMH
jgi:hypothetical protein